MRYRNTDGCTAPVDLNLIYCLYALSPAVFAPEKEDYQSSLIKFSIILAPWGAQRFKHHIEATGVRGLPKFIAKVAICNRMIWLVLNLNTPLRTQNQLAI